MDTEQVKKEIDYMSAFLRTNQGLLDAFALFPVPETKYAAAMLLIAMCEE